MWNVPVERMCRKHLLGEHVEMHMLIGSMSKNKSIKGFVERGLIDPELVIVRHNQIAEEMVRRGYNHKSPMDVDATHVLREYMRAHPEYINELYVDIRKSVSDLSERCPECAEKLENVWGD
jgi:hypothetical protein